MVNVSISEFVMLLVVPFWLRCFQSCVWVLNSKVWHQKKEVSLILSLIMLQEMYVLSPAGVDYATFGPGYSSLKRYQLESSMGAQAMIQHGGISLVFVRKII